MSDFRSTGILPAEAFIETYPYKLPAGALFKHRDSWALRVEYGAKPTEDWFIFLQGARAGHLSVATQGIARALSISDGFTWFAVIESNDPAASDALHTASLAIGEVGPVIVAGDADGDHVAFRLNGEPWDDYRAHTAMARFDRWSIYLSLTADPYRPLGQLCAVDRRRHRTA